MDLFTIAAFLLSLGVGGVVGAVASAALSAKRLSMQFNRFKELFREYVDEKEDEASIELVEAFEGLSQGILDAESAFNLLKRAMKVRR